MRKFYSAPAKLIAVFTLFIFLNTSAKTQVLNPGDIVFTGYISGSANEAFSFVVLVNISIGTSISFTDNGWDGTALGTTEFTATWAATTAVPAGREIHIFGPSGGAATAVFAGNGSSAGTVTGLMPGLPSAGDQILAYRGPSLSPTFLSGIHMNQYCTCIVECGTTTVANWDPAACVPGPNASSRPPGLVTGTNAIWIGTEGVANTDADNAVFNCTGPLGNAAQVRAAVNNPANWTIAASGPPTFTLPSNCTFMGLAPLPVKLESFTGKLNSDLTVTLQWKVAFQQGIQEYIVEESTDGVTYNYLGTVPSSNTDNHTYTFTDGQVATGNNYYRLKTVEQSGKIAYSDVILIVLKAGIKVNVYPNPVIDKLTIQQFESIRYKTAILSNGEGKILQHIKLNGFIHEVNMAIYPAGLYILKLEDGTIFKLIKQ